MEMFGGRKKKIKIRYCSERKMIPNTGQQENLTADCNTARKILQKLNYFLICLYDRGLGESGEKITRKNALGSSVIWKTETTQRAIKKPQMSREGLLS